MPPPHTALLKLHFWGDGVPVETRPSEIGGLFYHVVAVAWLPPGKELKDDATAAGR